MKRLPVVASAMTATLLVTPAPDPAGADGGYDGGSEPLRHAVTVDGVIDHLRAFQRIAGDNGGTRAADTPGFDATAAYVARKLRAAGYLVTEQEFRFRFFRELAPAELARVSPAGPDYETATFTYSGSGEVTGQVVPALNNVLPPAAEPGSTAGCAPADFAPAGDEPQIALVQRGGCEFAVKTANARAAGYDAVIIFNEGQPDRRDVMAGTLGEPSDLPVVALGFAGGSALAAAAASGAVTVRLRTNTETRSDAVTRNIVAESGTGDPDRVLVVGAHLDSVPGGPGINDNGSGSATVLEIAEQVAGLGIAPRQRLRFAFWGAEEFGLLGSEHYVGSLSAAERGRILANLNFDMLGSPNYVRFVYDGDGSDTGTAGPAGSGAIERVFTDWFTNRGLAHDPTAFDGRSDYGPFVAAGIPAGGLFSGAEGIKTEEQAARYGGTAGVAYDACYHETCDDTTNLNRDALSELGDAAAHAVYELAQTGETFTDPARRSGAAGAPGPATGRRAGPSRTAVSR